MNIRNELANIKIGSVTGDLTCDDVSLDNSVGFCIVYKKTNETTSDKTFTTVSLNSFDITNHGYKTGLKVRFTGASLPTGLSAGVDYFLIRISDNVLMVASSYENAINGEFISISGGSGTHTVHVQAYEPIYLKLQASIDDELWVDIPNGLVSLANSAQMLEHEAAYFHKLRPILLCDGGQYDVSCKIMVKAFK